MSSAREALDRIEASRRYTLNLLSDIPPADWFRMPHEGSRTSPGRWATWRSRSIGWHSSGCAGLARRTSSFFRRRFTRFSGGTRCRRLTRRCIRRSRRFAACLIASTGRCRSKWVAWTTRPNVPQAPRTGFQHEARRARMVRQPRDGARRPDRPPAPIVRVAAAVVRAPPGARGFREKNRAVQSRYAAGAWEASGTSRGRLIFA